jgi:hypothetical protein
MLRELKREAAEVEARVCTCSVPIPPVAERIGVPAPAEPIEEVCPDCGGLRCQACIPYYEIEEAEG